MAAVVMLPLWDKPKLCTCAVVGILTIHPCETRTITRCSRVADATMPRRSAHIQNIGLARFCEAEDF